MTPNGQLSEFSYVPLPFQKGAINANCSVELDGTDIVFGPDDIWRTTATPRSPSATAACATSSTARSTCRRPTGASSSTTRSWPRFRSATSERRRPHRLHRRRRLQSSCCLELPERHVVLRRPPVRLRRLHGEPQQPADVRPTATYVRPDGRLLSGSGRRLQAHALFRGRRPGCLRPVTSLYAQDPYGANSSVSYPVDTNATKPKYLARDGIDLDELNADLRGTKVLASIYPQARLGAGAAPLQINGGSGGGFNDPAVFVGYQPTTATQ
jgi:hypothetical protein